VAAPTRPLASVTRFGTMRECHLHTCGFFSVGFAGCAERDAGAGFVGSTGFSARCPVAVAVPGEASVVGAARAGSLVVGGGATALAAASGPVAAARAGGAAADGGGPAVIVGVVPGGPSGALLTAAVAAGTAALGRGFFAGAPGGA
jgi:hypothetical protein